MKLLPPPELTRSLPEFRKDHGDMTKVGFLIMSFGESDAHKDIVKAIQNTLERNGRSAIRADNKQYNDNLPANIKTYMRA